ncbi:LuxR C-terminal-related transcriptional regulator [Streptosporangium sp. NPDC048865]|uniref:helix-turn-helix transcriptional regulator n=1 Tax=Streptosporangium sp. NPDC048865 TaxID=3155766 RepID=UPI003443C011
MDHSLSTPLPRCRAGRDDREVAEWAKLIEAIANLALALVWPAAVVFVVWLIMRRHRDAFGRLIDRVESFSLMGNEVKLAAAAAVEQEAQVEELVREISSPDTDQPQREAAARRLANEAERLGRVRAIADPAADGWDLLAPKEVVIAAMIAENHTLEEIADQLDLTNTQVQIRLKQIRRKLGVYTFDEIVEIANRHRDW